MLRLNGTTHRRNRHKTGYVLDQTDYQDETSYSATNLKGGL